MRSTRFIPRPTLLLVSLLLPLTVLLSPVGAVTPSGLPNATRTPGALNLADTQNTISSTICVPGYTKRIRPPESYTYALKVQQLHSGYSVNGDVLIHDYEEDHLIALEIGGNPTSVKNLWPEPWHGGATTKWNASVKDRLENRLHQLVCYGNLPLATAQHAMATNWEAAYLHYVGPLG